MNATRTTIDKVCRLGSAAEIGSTFIHIQYKGGRLSITGVEGPTASGGARGSCGQIGDHLTVEEYAPGWDAEKLAKLAEIWDRWHLNDMRPGCEHQRDWDTREQLEIVTYRLTSDALQERDRIKKEAMAELLSGESVAMSEHDRAIASLPWEMKRAPLAEFPESGRYEVAKRETKAAGWVYPSEHDRGLLNKPCQICDYRYGSKWLFEEVPAEVLDWLAALPETDRQPAWV